MHLERDYHTSRMKHYVEELTKQFLFQFLFLCGKFEYEVNIQENTSVSLWCLSDQYGDYKVAQKLISFSSTINSLTLLLFVISKLDELPCKNIAKFKCYF